MELEPGMVAVVTGAASGIGRALSARFAAAGMRVVLADVEEDALARAADDLAVDDDRVLQVVSDVRDPTSVDRLAASTVERFGAVHVVCNNAGVGSFADPWLGPLEAWRWVLEVNLMGVVHGVRSFLPHLLTGGHIVNTASVAGLVPLGVPSYDAAKHGVVALSEDLHHQLRLLGAPVGVSCLCPGFVRTSILEAVRNWPSDLGNVPDEAPGTDVMRSHFTRALDEGMPPAQVADLVFDAVAAGRFWIFTHPDWIDVATRRWSEIAEGVDPVPPPQMPGLAPWAELEADLRRSLGLVTG